MCSEPLLEQVADPKNLDKSSSGLCPKSIISTHTVSFAVALGRAYPSAKVSVVVVEIEDIVK